MTRRFVVLCSLTVLLSAALLQAHGEETHLMGTVTAVTANTVTIKDTAGKSVVVMLGKTTKYVKDKKPAAAADLKVGTRVMINATMDEKMKMYTAEELQLGVVDTKAAQPQK